MEEKGLSVETADKIGTFVKIRGPPLELLSNIMGGTEGSELLKHNASKEALGDLSILFDALYKSRCIDKVVFDLSLARGLDYYTGVIFEAAFKGGVQVNIISARGYECYVHIHEFCTFFLCYQIYVKSFIVGPTVLKFELLCDDH